MDRGFTFHEHLYPFTLINMNGRVYDPLVGRFLSPDNYVQQPTNSQNFNRYSYCINNPLKYTDKTGNWFGIDDLVAAAIGGTINWAMNGCRFDA
ncbi:MAG TPA: RHS repeat-associated core domain-containing protein [Bacteroidales bacterium]|nr:RHS repeat-associated core domain-containing protein [Bacteroidales bacterium]